MERDRLRVWLGALALATALGCSAAPAPQTAALDEPDAHEPRVALPSGFEAARVDDPHSGAPVHVVEAGPAGGPGVVLVHGVGGSAREWDALMRALAPRYRVLAPDLPGFGRSPEGARGPSPADHAALDASLARSRLGAPYHLIGHSLGAGVAIEVAARAPDDVAGLMLVDAAGILEPRALAAALGESAVEEALGDSRIGRFFRRLVRGRAHDAPAWLDRLTRHLLAPDAEAGGEPDEVGRRAALALVLHDFGPALDAVVAPTLVVWGAEDRVAPVRTGWALASRISDARLELWAGVGHAPPREAPDRFAATTLAWLRGERPADPTVPGAPDRDAHCRRGRGETLSGRYREIRIESCRDVTLRRVRAERLEVTKSVVWGEDVVVRGEGVAVSVVGSELTLSGGHLAGEVSIETRKSDLDLAGVTLEARDLAFRATGATNLICSVCRLRDRKGDRGLHEARSLGRGSTLP